MSERDDELLIHLDPTGARSDNEATVLRQSPGYEMGRNEERARIAAILAMRVPGFEREVDDAIARGTEPEALAMQLLTIQRDRGVSLLAMQEDSVRVPHATAGGEGTGDRHGWGRVAAKFKGEAQRGGNRG